MLINKPLQHRVEPCVVVLCLDGRHAPHSIKCVPVGIVHLAPTEEESACRTRPLQVAS